VKGNNPHDFLSADEIDKQLSQVIELAASDSKNDPALGILTADDRDFWANVFQIKIILYIFRLVKNSFLHHQ